MTLLPEEIKSSRQQKKVIRVKEVAATCEDQVGAKTNEVERKGEGNKEAAHREEDLSNEVEAVLHKLGAETLHEPAVVEVGLLQHKIAAFGCRLSNTFDNTICFQRAYLSSPRRDARRMRMRFRVWITAPQPRRAPSI